MKGIQLTYREMEIYNYVKTFVDNKQTSYKLLAAKLNKSVKTAYNYVHNYKNFGKEAFSHKNKGRKPAITKSDDLRNQILEIFNKLEVKPNIRHFRDILEERENIKVSYNFLYRLLNNNNIISEKAHRKTIKNYKKMIKQKLDNKEKLNCTEQSYVADYLLEDYEAHPRKSRAKFPGELLQMDASNHVWFGNQKSQLHIAVDDCSGAIVGAYFDQEETLNGYYQITKQFILKYGIPAQILTDNRTVFNYNKNGKSSEERDTFTQYGFMCHKFGIALYTSSIPQVKGRVERLFQTLQSRLVVELSLDKIKTIDEANNYLPQFIERFNNEFSLLKYYTTFKFESLLDSQNIDDYLAIVSRRKIDNGCTLKYNNKYYKIVNSEGEQILVKAHTECLVVKTFSNELIAIIGDEQYFLDEHETHKEESIFEEKTPKSKAHKPACNHPWKMSYYENYRKNYRPKQQNNYAYIY